MSQSIPRVSVGLAVYNGENYIREAIDSILNQTFTDFELVICDNASSDRTDEICRDYAAKDARIRYYRNDSNIGGILNQIRVLQLSRGEFFKLAAHDDVCAPQLLELCVAALDENPDAVLAYPRATVIDEHGEVSESDEMYVTHTNAAVPLALGKRPADRFRDMACMPHSCYHIFGLMRMSAIASIPPWGTYSGSDRSLLARMALLGRYVEVPERLFFLRRHSRQSINILRQSIYLYNTWFSTANKGKLILPGWKIFFEYVTAIRKTPMSGLDRIACYGQLVIAYLPRNSSRMVKDLLVASIQIGDLIVRRLRNDMRPEAMDTLILGRFPRLN